jgi:hypothetical protein
LAEVRFLHGSPITMQSNYSNFLTQSDIDKFGYYTVGNKKTYSKLDAILTHGKTGNHPDWHFNDQEFSLHDWTIEPAEGLDELYRARAQGIRDRYDYLVLFYSGGADSTNILQTFLKNDIKLDEIAQFHSHEGDNGDSDSNFSAEVTKVAIPWSLKVTDQYTHIKHRVIDQSQLIESIYEMPEIKYDFLFQQNTCISPNNFSRAYLRKVVKDYSDMIAQGKRVCFIWGGEKPRLYQIDGKYCFRFLDMIDNCVSPMLQQSPQDGYYDELFYWSPEFATGLIKQSHMVMRDMKTLPLNDVNFTDDYSPFGSVTRNGKRWNLTNHGLHQIIYPGWDISTFSVGKKRSPILSLRDSWYLNKSTGSNLRFMDGIKQFDSMLTNTLDGYWKNESSLMQGVKGCLSKPYFIEK